MERQTLKDASPALYDEVVAHLRAGEFSSLGETLTPDEAELVVQNLATATIAQRCGCRQDDCETFDFRTGSSPEDALLVRFHVDGELLLLLDRELGIRSVERLYGDGNAKVVYGKQDDGSFVPVAWIDGDVADDDAFTTSEKERFARVANNMPIALEAARRS